MRLETIKKRPLDKKSYYLNNLKEINSKSEYRDGFGKDSHYHLDLTIYSALMGYPDDTKKASIIRTQTWTDFLYHDNEHNRTLRIIIVPLMNSGKFSARLSLTNDEDTVIGEPKLVDQILKDVFYVYNNTPKEIGVLTPELIERHTRIGKALGYSASAIESFLARMNMIFKSRHRDQIEK